MDTNIQIILHLASNNSVLAVNHANLTCLERIDLCHRYFIIYALFNVNPLNAGPDYIRFYIFLLEYYISVFLNISKVKRDRNQQYLNIFNIYFVKFLRFSLT